MFTLFKFPLDLLEFNRRSSDYKVVNNFPFNPYFDVVRDFSQFYRPPTRRKDSKPIVELDERRQFC